MQTVLLADDDLLLRRFLQEALERKGKKVIAVKNGKEAIEQLQKNDFDLILTDMKMPEASGLEVLKKVKETSWQTIVLLMTAFGSIENAVEAMRLGAFNYLIKPFSLEALEAVLEKAEKHQFLLKENFSLKQRISSLDNLQTFQLNHKSPSMKKVWEAIQKVAQSHANVFITGESGSGKEVIASAIHHLSPRREKPFIRVNCAAIPESLMETEFFGHEKGAFTGAIQRRMGRFELAHGGTLLLDEVTEIPIHLQAKLLRVIQEQTFESLGSDTSKRVDVRIIATSNRNMQEAIEKKIFREDLYYRLHVLPIQLPPLRERKEDIPMLATHFLHRFCQENHKESKELTTEALKKLCLYSWPGNVRELANILERAVVLSTEKIISAEDLQMEVTKTFSPTFSTHLTTLKEKEKQWILETLKKCNYKKEKTAQSLGISARTLRNKLQEYGFTNTG